MSGSDKQTYYKMGTSPHVPDSAEAFAKTLTAAGCVHGDLALAEGIGSLREFYHLVQAGVPFPHDALGSYIGYKTDHDPSERATSAGPKTSKFMSACLQRQAEDCGMRIFDSQEVARLLTRGRGGNQANPRRADGRSPAGRRAAAGPQLFLLRELVLAAGGPGELYKTTSTRGQLGLHGLALKAGLAAENLTESQFGLASIRFRWNVSGTYMQAIPRIFSTDADGGDEREFLAEYFPTMRRWPPTSSSRATSGPSIRSGSRTPVVADRHAGDGRDVARPAGVHGFPPQPRGPARHQAFRMADLDDEARDYLDKAGATQRRPIERLAHMNPPAIEIYAEHGIDLRREPLEIAVCASTTTAASRSTSGGSPASAHTFVIGEMAGTHGVKRPGGSALNAGQVGGLRAAEYIANVYPPRGERGRPAALPAALRRAVADLAAIFSETGGLDGREVIGQIQDRMTASGGHIREIADARAALQQAVALWRQVRRRGFRAETAAEALAAIRARHLALTSVAYLKAIVTLLAQGGGSRGSHLVLHPAGTAVHPEVRNPQTGRPLQFKKENRRLRKGILRLEFDPTAPDLFRCRNVSPRRVRREDVAFEVAWDRFRKGRIFT